MIACDCSIVGLKRNSCGLNVFPPKIIGGNEERVTGQGQKGDPCYEVAKNLAALCSCCSVSWQVELMSDDIWLFG